jgi:hypothetical protein
MVIPKYLSQMKDFLLHGARPDRSRNDMV